MGLPNEISYDGVKYTKNVKTGMTKDGHQYTTIRYDSDFGTCLISETGLYVNDTEYNLEKRLKSAGINLQ